MKLKGWRGIITIHQQGDQKIATKTAKDPSKKGSINKEAQILQYLTEQNILFVPQLIEQGDGWFSYKRIEGDHFKKIYRKQKTENKKKLVLQLLTRAYELDKVGVVHGEFIRPFTNMLVTPDNEIAILDFERGSMGDASGKNMRSYAQRLLAEGWIDLPTCKKIGNMDREEIYNHLSKKLQSAKLDAPMSCRLKRSVMEKSYKYLSTSLRCAPDDTTLSGATIFHLLLIILILVGGDMLTKYLFYHLQRGSEYRLFTPVLNTGIGRSLPVPLPLVLIATIAIVGGVIWLWKQQALTTSIMVLIVSGALGNGLDRVVFHGVRDFIDFHVRPVFNLADIYLSLAVIVVLYLSLVKKHA